MFLKTFLAFTVVMSVWWTYKVHVLPRLKFPFEPTCSEDTQKVIETTLALKKSSQSWLQMFDSIKGPIGPCIKAGHSTAICQVPKNLSSQFLYMLCRIYFPHLNDAKFPTIHSTSGETVINVFVKSCAPFQSLAQTGCLQDCSARAIVARNPVKRFVSAWLYLCKTLGNCFNCSCDDICCFIRDLAQLLLGERKPADVAPELESFQDTFFHFLPQVQFDNVGICNNRTRIVLNLESDTKDVILSKVDNLFDNEFVRKGWGPNGAKQFLSEKTQHSTKHLQKKVMEMLRNNKDYIRLIEKIYADDMKLVGS